MSEQVEKLESNENAQEVAEGYTIAGGKPVSISNNNVLDKIESAQYYQFPNTTKTVCCLILYNGFTVIGESACIDPQNFSAIKGRELAHEDAVRKIYQLEAYRIMHFMTEPALDNQVNEVLDEYNSTMGMVAEEGKPFTDVK